MIGAANLAADGLSMGVGNYLSIRAHESALVAEKPPPEELHAWRHGLATFVAFVAAGAVPLLPYLIPATSADRFLASLALTFVTLFGVGAVRGTVTADRWWKSGAEMLGLGVVVAGAAYAAGAVAAALIGR